jgi:hypothetical protein
MRCVHVAESSKELISSVANGAARSREPLSRAAILGQLRR